MNRPVALALGLGAGFAALRAYAEVAVRRHETLDRGQVRLPGRLVDAGGLEIHFQEAGRGEPLLLLHGLGAWSYSFRHNLPALARRYRALALDLPGFGFSDRPAEGDYTVGGQARAVGAFMDALRIPSATVLGHSMGGAVALHLAAAEPQRVRRLILVDSATTEFASWWRRPLTAVTLPLFSIGFALGVLQRPVYRFLLSTGVYDPSGLTEEALDNYVLPTRLPGTRLVLPRVLWHLQLQGLPELRRVRQPALILWGSHDRWLPPRGARWLQARLPHAELVVMDRVGHLPLEECPAESNRLLLEWLQRTERAAPAGEPETSHRV